MSDREKALTEAIHGWATSFTR